MKRNGSILRDAISLTLLLSGVVVLVTSIVLYCGPPTHVAHFSDWRVMGLTKCQWNAIHIVIGLLFMIVMLFHVYLNRKPIFMYLGNSNKKPILFTKAFVLSLAITLYVSVGTLAGLPPMKQLIDFVRIVKVKHVRRYEVPPYGGAEQSSLRDMSAYMGWDNEESAAALRKKGFELESPEQSIKEIAEINGVTVSAVVEGMKP